MAIADLTTKAGDTPVFAYTLTNPDGTVPSLTGATVRFVMRSLQSAAPVALTGTATITNPATGQVQYAFTAADTAVAGDYEGSWVVTPAGGGAQTFPPVGYLSIVVEPSLTTAPMQLVSIPDVRDYLNIQSTDKTHDAKLGRFIAAATPVVENIVGPLLVRNFEEWHDGGQYWIRLRRRPSYGMGTNPVFNLVGVDEYRGPIKYPLAVIQDPAHASIYSVMLDPRAGTVYRRTTGGGVIPFGAGPFGGAMPSAVFVMYQAGQNPIPANVYEATLELLRVNYQTTMAVGRGARTRADETDIGTPLGFFVPRRVHELLSPMRRAPAVA